MLWPGWPILGSNPRWLFGYNANGFVRRIPSRLTTENPPTEDPNTEERHPVDQNKKAIRLPRKSPNRGPEDGKTPSC